MVGLIKKEPVYVTYTCKKCGCAFVDLDPNDDINEVPLKNRYCPDCVAKGFTNKNLKPLTQKEVRQLDFKTRIKNALKENNITDKKDASFITKEMNKRIKQKELTGQKVYFDYLFKEAIEVLGYQSWKQ